MPVIFLRGDRVPAPAATAASAAARLQQPAELRRILLAAKFPGAASLTVVEPRRYDAQDCACYEGWLPPGALHQGVPPRFDAAGFPAATQLAATLRQAAAAAGAAGPQPGLLPPDTAAVLVGFSKAGVVLHQVLVELAAWQQRAGQACAACTWQQRQQERGSAAAAGAPPLPAAAAAGAASLEPPPSAQAEAALAAVRELHWLDAGANIKGAAHASDPALFQALARRCAAHTVTLCLHGTPRQWHDPARRWLGREAAAMAAAAAAAGVRCASREYLCGQAPSLDQHFAVIEAFEPGAVAAAAAAAASAAAVDGGGRPGAV